MTDRADLIDRFIQAHKWGRAERKELPHDLSHRRYQRLTRATRAGGKETVLVMDAPPEHEDVRPYIAIDTLLRELGYSAPEIHAKNVKAGLLLIEDFGYATFTRVLRKGLMTDRDLYGLAIDFLVDLHTRDLDQTETVIPAYTDDDLLVEAFLFTRWYLPGVGAKVTEALDDEFLQIMHEVLRLSRAGVAEHLVLRDFHVDNLMMLPKREGLRQLGLLDFQDAVMGPVTYDLISLLRDARRDVPHALAVEMTARYLNDYPDQDPLPFMTSCAAMSIQRNLKILGIFMRQSIAHKNHSKLVHMNRIWRMIEEDARHPAMKFFRDWIDATVPPSKRKVSGVPAE
ncbi:MAG: phosphotransferase [Alphaproteobacteria bacterium]|nr:phosphotransferase [Alphaproteobacteria bacterium]